MPEAKSKTINGVVFTVSQPYEPGHTINEAEARVLNQTRSENIGNNVRAKLKEMAEAGESLETMQAHVAEKDAEYVFTLGNVGEGAKLDPYEREAQKLARELIKEKLADSGRKLTVTPEGYTDDEWKAKIGAEVERIMVMDQVVKAAKKRVDDRRKTGEALMSSLEGSDL